MFAQDLSASVIPLAMLFAISLMKVFAFLEPDELRCDWFWIDCRWGGNYRRPPCTNLSRKGKSRNRNGRRSLSHQQNKWWIRRLLVKIHILIVYFLILALVGIEGKMFRVQWQKPPLSAIIGALISLTYVPMMSLLFLSKKISHKRIFQIKWWVRIQRDRSYTKGAVPCGLQGPWCCCLRSTLQPP